MTTPSEPKYEEEVAAYSEAGDMEDPVKVADDESSDDLKKKDDDDDDKVAQEEEEEEEEEARYENVREYIMLGLKYICAVLLVVYLLASFIIDFERATAWFVITVAAIVYNIYAYWEKNNEEAFLAAEDRLLNFLEKSDSDWKYGGGLASILLVIMVIMMAVTVKDSRNLISLFGLIVFLGLTWILSWKPSKVKLRPVLGGIFIQFIFGYCVIRTSWGFEAIDFLSGIFTTLLGYTVAGSSFVFGWLTNGSLFAPGAGFVQESGNVFVLGPPFFFNVLPSVIFFSSLMSVGYYIRVLPWLVRKLGTYDTKLYLTLVELVALAP